MKKIGIITIHKIVNYGSVLQAYALQQICEQKGFCVNIIDYHFPNDYHLSKPSNIEPDSVLTLKEKILKYAFGIQLLRQHKGISNFVKKYLHLTQKEYCSPIELQKANFDFDIYISGSDQIWSTHHCKGDPSFLLHFAPDTSNKFSYASSFGGALVEEDFKKMYIENLSRLNNISVREQSGAKIVKALIGKDAAVVLDPTLLLDRTEWNKIAIKERIIKEKYILCYYLNYSFNAHPYVEILTDKLQKQSGYKIVWLARPPKRFLNKKTSFCIDASPETFLALIRDSEAVLTTSFHGTAFAVNYGKPVISIVKNKNSLDSRQADLLRSLGLYDNIIELDAPIPSLKIAYYDESKEQETLSLLRKQSLLFLDKSLNYRNK